MFLWKSKMLLWKSKIFCLGVLEKYIGNARGLFLLYFSYFNVAELKNCSNLNGSNTPSVRTPEQMSKPNG